MKRRSHSKEVFHNLICVTAIYIASGLRTTINCNETSLSTQFDKIFNIGILLNDNTVAQIEGKSQLNVPDSGVPVTNVTGTLSGGDTYLMAVVDVECLQTDNIQCEIFGLLQDKENYKNEKFKPLLTFEVEEANMSISKTPDRDHYSMDDVVRVQCFANVGSNRSNWRFHVDCQGVCLSQYDVGEDSIVTTASRSDCVFHSIASINVTVKEEGPVRIRCKVDDTEVGSITLESDDIEATLSLHLFLSCIFLVYFPFIYMPSLWCHCPACSRTWRNPEKDAFKYVRSAICVGDSFAFMLWWIVVYVRYGDRQEFVSYGIFAAIEGSFIFLYGLYRFLFKILDSSEFGNARAYNARVTTSHGAVMTPIICWLMIRFSRGLSCSSLEIFFWCIAIPSLLSFAFVSHRREGEDWTRKKKS